MTIDQLIASKKAELYALPFYQHLLSGNVTPKQYYHYLLENRFIHDYIDHKSTFKNFEDLKRELRLEVDKMEMGVEVFPYSPDFRGSGIGEEYAILNMFKGTEQANAHAYAHYLEILDSSDSLKDKVPGKGRIFTFNKPISIYTDYLNQNKPTEEWVGEIEKAYDIRIEIVDYLNTLL